MKSCPEEETLFLRGFPGDFTGEKNAYAGHETLRHNGGISDADAVSFVFSDVCDLSGP